MGSPQNGWFGKYGGRFVPETLVPALEELSSAYDECLRDAAFQDELRGLLASYVGRPTPLYFARQLTERARGAEIHLKREDLNHTGAHKINNAIGQALLARRLGKKRVIAETGAGQHGVAAATACAMLGLECRVFMGALDVLRQRPNVQRMRLLGAEVVPVEAGSRTLKDAINAAMREWVATSRDTHYLVGSVVGPDPFPRMVRDFQAVIGRETLTQCLERFGGPPDAAIACVGGGSNAMGLFHALLGTTTDLIGVEAAGEGLSSGRHAASLAEGSEGVLHGARTVLLQDDDGQIVEAHSVSAGLDYPGVGPEHAFLRDSGRVRYVAITDGEALCSFRLLARLEGIVPALESAHAIAFALAEAARRPSNSRVVVNLSGRGDKDLDHVLSVSGARP